MVTGSLFQSLGAAAAKAQSPVSLSLVFRSTERSGSADLRQREGTGPVRHLYIHRAVLKSSCRAEGASEVVTLYVLALELLLTNGKLRF